MQLGAPLVEAQLRKRAFQRQLKRDNDQRQFQTNQLLAEQAFRERMQESDQSAARALEARRQSGTSERVKEQIRASSKLAEASRDQRDRHHKDNVSLSERRLEESNRSDVERMAGGLQPLIKKRIQLERMLSDHATRTKLRLSGSLDDALADKAAVESALDLLSAKAQKSVAENDDAGFRTVTDLIVPGPTPSAAVPGSVFKDNPRPQRGNFQFIHDAIEGTSVGDRNTGQVFAPGQLQPAIPPGPNGPVQPNPAPIVVSPEPPKSITDDIFGSYSVTNGTLQRR